MMKHHSRGHLPGHPPRSSSASRQLKGRHFGVSAVSVAGLLTSESALAYIDPGTGSILLQGLIAAVAGALVTMGAYWERVKALFRRNASQVEDRSDAD